MLNSKHMYFCYTVWGSILNLITEVVPEDLHRNCWRIDDDWISDCISSQREWLIYGISSMIRPWQLHHWISSTVIFRDFEDSRRVSSWTVLFPDPRGYPVCCLASSGEFIWRVFLRKVGIVLGVQHGPNEVVSSAEWTSHRQTYASCTCTKTSPKNPIMRMGMSASDLCYHGTTNDTPRRNYDDR